MPQAGAPPEEVAPELKEGIEDFRDIVDQLYEDALRPMPRRLARWREYQSFYRGFQHIIPTSWTEEAYGSIDPRQEFETANQVQAIVRQSVAKKLQAFPLNPEVSPAYDGVLARAKAEASQRLLRSFPRNGVLPFVELVDAVYAAEIFGGAYLNVYWDPMAGPKAGGAPLGDIRVRAVTLLDAIPDPASRSEPEDRHLFHRFAMPMSQARQMFPTDIYGEESHFLLYGARTNSGFSEMLRDDRGLFESCAASEPNQIVEIIWYYERPSIDHPGGRLLCYSGPTVLDVSEELPDKVWPWIWIPGPNRAPGVRIPDGMVHNLRSPQRSLNHALSKIRENASLCVNPAMLVPVAAGVQAEKLDDLPGTLLKYNAAGGKPEWMPVPGVPQGLYEMTAKMKEILSDVSSYSDVSQGTPQGDLSGRAILNLDQLNNMVHGPENGIFQEQCVKLLKTCLTMAHTRYDDGRMVQMFGDNNRWTSQAWKGAEFDPDVEILVDPFSQEPTSRAARFAQAVEIKQLNGYEDDPGAQRFREAIGIDTNDRDAVALGYAHKRRARQEDLQLITTGEMFPPLFADDDPTHLDCHLQTYLSDEVQADPDRKDILEQHMELHEQAMAQKQASLIGGPAGGGGSPPGGPGDTAVQAPSPADGGHSTGIDSQADVSQANGAGPSAVGNGVSNA